MENSIRSSSFWDHISTKLDMEMPEYLRNLLSFTGYDSALPMKSMSEKDISEVEAFARSTLPEIVPQEQYVRFLGVFWRHPRRFQILPGHRKLLQVVISYLNEGHVLDIPKPVSAMTRAADHVTSPRGSDHVTSPRGATCAPSSSTSHHGEGWSSLPHIREDTKVLVSKLNAWLQRDPMLPPGLSVPEDFDVHVAVDSSVKGLSSGLSKASVTCPGCNMPLKLVMMAHNRSWVLCNFQRHLRRCYRKVGTCSQSASTSFQQNAAYCASAGLANGYAYSENCGQESSDSSHEEHGFTQVYLIDDDESMEKESVKMENQDELR